MPTINDVVEATLCEDMDAEVNASYKHAIEKDY